MIEPDCLHGLSRHFFELRLPSPSPSPPPGSGGGGGVGLFGGPNGQLASYELKCVTWTRQRVVPAAYSVASSSSSSALIPIAVSSLASSATPSPSMSTEATPPLTPRI